MGANWSKSVPILNYIPGLSLPHKVGHAAVGLYRNCQMSGEQGQMSLNQWRENGEMKIVVKGENASQLDELNRKAKDAGDVFVYLVRDAGHTQIPAGSKTVLGVFGTIEAVDRITGGLKLF